MRTIDVRDSISEADFLAEYVCQKRPVVVRELKFERSCWTPGYLKSQLGELTAQVYDSLFDLQEVSTLAEYFDRDFSVSGELCTGVPDARWCNPLKGVDQAEAFRRLSPHWQAPEFLPRGGLRTPSPAARNPACDMFPR